MISVLASSRVRQESFVTIQIYNSFAVIIYIMCIALHVYYIIYYIYYVYCITCILHYILYIYYVYCITCILNYILYIYIYYVYCITCILNYIYYIYIYIYYVMYYMYIVLPGPLLLAKPPTKDTITDHLGRNSSSPFPNRSFGKSVLFPRVLEASSYELERPFFPVYRLRS